MFGTEALLELYQHMEWADSRVWQSVLRAPNASGDADLRGRLFHVHFTQRAFLQVWTRTPVDRWDPARFATTAEIYAWVRNYYQEVSGFLATLRDADLEQPLTVPWARLYEKQLGRPAATNTLAQTLFQVTSHSTYHRGQINTRLRQLGVEPPLVDYIAWLWGNRPGTEWP